MKTLFVLSHRDFIGTFESVIQELAARGHEVRVGVATKKQPPTLPERLAEEAAIQAIACPSRRRDEWGPAARLLRSLRDFSFYLDRGTQQPRDRVRVLVRRACRGLGYPTFRCLPGPGQPPAPDQRPPRTHTAQPATR